MLRSTASAFARLLARFLDPSAAAWLIVRSAAEPAVVARRAVLRIDGLVAPSPADVVGGFLRGRILFGVPHAARGEADVRFEWYFHERHAVVTAETKHTPTKVQQHRRALRLDERFDTDFSEVLRACRREGYTWLTDDLVLLYEQLHSLGYASSIGVYRDDELVGGLFGLQIGRIFSAMSVFHRMDSAGSIAWAALMDAIGAEGRWDLVHLGELNAHHRRFGAREIPVAQLQDQMLLLLRSQHIGQ